MDIILTKLVSVVITPFLFVTGLFGITPDRYDTNIDLGVAVPTSVALFETSLATAITDSATSMTLVSATTKNGTTLATSTYAFIIDEGTANEEFVTATCVATACTGMTRGLSVITGDDEVTALKKAHRRGASVKITDAPQLLILSRLLNGDESLPNPIKYNSISTTTLGLDSNNLASVGYANSLSFGAVAQASETAGGFVEIATGSEAASSTSSGSSARLVLPASLSTSTAPSSGHYVPITGSSDGNLAEGFLPTTLTQNYTFSGTTTFSGVIASPIPIVQTYNASSTWTKPAGLKYVDVACWAGGGSGGATTSGTAGNGGGGSYGTTRIFASNLSSTVAVTIGSGGEAPTGTNPGNAGGNSSFGSHLTVYGGGGGAGGATGAGGGGGGSSSVGSSGSGSTAGAGGTPTAGTAGSSAIGGISTYGGGGGGDETFDGGDSIFGGGGGAGRGGTGGKSFYGGGGGGTTTGGTSVYGGAGGSASAGVAPGGGGSGRSGNGDGFAGAKGRCTVTEYYF